MDDTRELGFDFCVHRMSLFDAARTEHNEVVDLRKATAVGAVGHAACGRFFRERQYLAHER